MIPKCSAPTLRTRGWMTPRGFCRTCWGRDRDCLRLLVVAMDMPPKRGQRYPNSHGWQPPNMSEISFFYFYNQHTRGLPLLFTKTIGEVPFFFQISHGGLFLPDFHRYIFCCLSGP